MPLLTILECRLAGHLHLPPREVRRKPLALALLWCNYAAQQDGLETWWTVRRADAVSDAEVDSKIQAAKAGQNEPWMDWEGE